MARWREQARELLYDGESVREILEFDAAAVVVTSHRVLAFTPDAEGANFRQVDRPNVEGVDTGATSAANLLERAVRYGLIGVVLIIAGQFINLEGMLGGTTLNTEASGQLGLGGIMGTLQSMLNLLTQLDTLLQTFGALALLLAVVLFGVYWYTRDRTLVIQVAGGDDIHIPRPEDAELAVQRLTQAITPGSAGETASPSESAES